jgi:hypothetical protein
MFPHHNIHTYTWTSPEGKNQTDHVLTDRKWHSSIPDIRYFRGAGSDSDHSLVVARVRERYDLRKLYEGKVKYQY